MGFRVVASAYIENLRPNGKLFLDLRREVWPKFTSAETRICEIHVVKSEISHPDPAATPVLCPCATRRVLCPLVHRDGRVGRAAKRWKSEFSGPNLRIWRYVRYLREPVWRSQLSLTAEMDVDTTKRTLLILLMTTIYIQSYIYRR